MIRLSVITLLALSLTLLISACGCFSGNSSTEFNNEGHRLFEQYCVTCHGKTGELGLNEAADLKISELGKENIVELIRLGKGMMPPYQKVLSEKQIQQVAEYTITLR